MLTGRFLFFIRAVILKLGSLVYDISFWTDCVTDYVVSRYSDTTHLDRYRAEQLSARAIPCR